MKIDKKYLKAASTQEHLENIDKMCRSAPPGDFMECGVLRGGTAAVIIQAAEGKRKIWLCDTFAGYPIPDARDVGIDRRPFVPGYGAYPIPVVTKRLTNFGLSLENVEFVKGEFKDSFPGIENRVKKLALVNFDGDWYKSVFQAFPLILDKLVPGGILIIHDYPKFKGLVKAVHQFIPEKKIKRFSEDPNYSGVYYIKE